MQLEMEQVRCHAPMNAFDSFVSNGPGNPRSGKVLHLATSLVMCGTVYRFPIRVTDPHVAPHLFAKCVALLWDESFVAWPLAKQHTLAYGNGG